MTAHSSNLIPTHTLFGSQAGPGKPIDCMQLLNMLSQGAIDVLNSSPRGWVPQFTMAEVMFQLEGGTQNASSRWKHCLLTK